MSGGPGSDSKDSGELSSLPMGPTVLDTRPLQSSALLDSSSSSGPNNPSTSFEPVKVDPTGGEYRSSGAGTVLGQKQVELELRAPVSSQS